ncbi:MAG: quinoprotein dehydrogenase-associated SoxYZ-like carrier [Paracoccaceae bacterium]
MIARRIVLAAIFGGTFACQALAESSWDFLKDEVFDGREPVISADIVALEAPYRTQNDPRTDIGARVNMPFGEFVKSVTLILDENPMPVSAVFEMAEPQRAFAFRGTMRVNGPTMVRVVAETDQGKLYMSETFVKTSGTGACSAPPGTDPLLALQTIGTMKFRIVPEVSEKLLASLDKAAAASGVPVTGRMVELDIEHPSHSGMQMDQITLLFIPARYVETVEIKTDGKPQFTMTGSISFSENPAIQFEIPGTSVGVGVKMTDTKGAVFEEEFNLSGG